MSNVIQLPRTRRLRPSPARLGHYLRVGHNDHREIAHLLAEGERGYLGLIVDPRAIRRHRELIAQAGNLGMDVVLDPKSHAAALIGGYSDSLGKLPWGLGRQATLADFTGSQGIRRADEIASFVNQSGCSALVAPTRLISDPNDPWFDADRRVAARLRAILPSKIALAYSLAVPMQVLRNADVRAALIEGLRGVDMDALWLKVENFGADATGEKVRAYIEAATDFHQLGVAIVADHAGGLPGLGLMAFGSVGGIAHGVMMLEGFKASSWRRVPSGSGRTPSPRVYVHGLDALISKADAAMLVDHSTRVRAQHACRDPRCCPRGFRDMTEQPVRHYLYRRAREVEALSAAPVSLRAGHFLEQSLRPRSDALAAVAALNLDNERLTRTLSDKNRHMSRMRIALADLADRFDPQTIAQSPLSRQQREDG